MGAETGEIAHDIHSFAEPNAVRVKHCSLDLAASFEHRTLTGSAGLHLDRRDTKAPLMLDTRELSVEEVRCGRYQKGANVNSYPPAKFTLGNRDAILGTPLRIELATDADFVWVRYASQPQASGLQWLSPHQTAGRKHPFLFSQNESIHARSWIPIQDSPGVRITYDATIRVPAGLKALMSAEQKQRVQGVYKFSMELPIPAYLIALAVGDLDFASTGPRTGVYAEPSILASAHHEFADTEKMVEAVEKLYGPYRWGRYDLLILPPSFPFGGMENPRLTFATPTVIAGDRSLVSLVSHELAHSWSGNLVTNATWGDFWLNEGFTTYIENRIQEEVYGREEALMEQVLDRRELERELHEFEARDQILHIELKGRDPDDAMSQIPYFKGALLLRQMEQAFGRLTFDRFLRDYFSNFAFQSITTDQALSYMRSELFEKHKREAQNIPLEDWINKPGLPSSAPRAVSERLNEVRASAHRWASGQVKTSSLDPSKWVTQEWLEFLQVLPQPLAREKMSELDRSFHLTHTGNDEILDEWLLLAVRSEYEPAYGRLDGFLLRVGRLKYIKPLYGQLMRTPQGQIRAREVYAKARSGYHPIAQAAIDKIVKV